MVVKQAQENEIEEEILSFYRIYLGLGQPARSQLSVDDHGAQHHSKEEILKAKGGKTECPEKSPRSQIEINPRFNSVSVFVGGT